MITKEFLQSAQASIIKETEDVLTPLIIEIDKRVGIDRLTLLLDSIIDKFKQKIYDKPYVDSSTGFKWWVNEQVSKDISYDDFWLIRRYMALTEKYQFKLEEFKREDDHNVLSFSLFIRDIK